VRSNNSWILSRILRDFDYWKPELIKNRLREILQMATDQDVAKALKNGRDPPPARTHAGLCVSIFHAPPKNRVAGPVADWTYYSGVLVAILQLAISVIPWALNQRWGIFMITASGIFLAYATGALPQWKVEKWGYRHAEKTVVLTRGNGAQHALVIVGSKDFFDLEVLANGDPKRSSYTRFCSVVLALLWIVHLITLRGIEENPWYLMAIGGIGMIHSVMVAGLPRRPEALGLPLEFEECIAEPKVMETLKQVEIRHPQVGAAMIGTFFPGKLREDEVQWWADKAAEHERERKRAPVGKATQSAPSLQS
jgi:hypothetical protein